jgi:hypothetical protein
MTGKVSFLPSFSRFWFSAHSYWSGFTGHARSSAGDNTPTVTTVGSARQTGREFWQQVCHVARNCKDASLDALCCNSFENYFGGNYQISCNNDNASACWESDYWRREFTETLRISLTARRVSLAMGIAFRVTKLRMLPAPASRAKGARRVIEMLLADDAVAPAGAACAGLSDRAARRLFDRLVALGAVRELSGRDIFRIYGL